MSFWMWPRWTPDVSAWQIISFFLCFTDIFLSSSSASLPFNQQLLVFIQRRQNFFMKDDRALPPCAFLQPFPVPTLCGHTSPLPVGKVHPASPLCCATAALCHPDSDFGVELLWWVCGAELGVGEVPAHGALIGAACSHLASNLSEQFRYFCDSHYCTIQVSHSHLIY